MTGLRISLFSFSRSGGAGHVVSALAQGFQTLGHEVAFQHKVETNLRSETLGNLPMVIDALKDEHFVKAKGWPSLISHYRDKNSFSRLGAGESDLTVFRWMNGLLGDFSQTDPRIFGKVAWGLADANPFTGVCHYTLNCKGFETDCSDCPAVRPKFKMAPKENLETKKALMRHLNPSFVAPTDWMFSTASQSSILRQYPLEKILNPLQSVFFRGQTSRKGWKGPIRVLVLGANLDDPIKGIWSEIAFLKKLAHQPSFQLEMIGVASGRLQGELPGVIFHGQKNSEDVRSLLREGHILLVPSLSETAGMVIAEAASQGVPSVVRNTGGMPEMTGYGRHGYIFDSQEQLNSIFQNLTMRELKEKSLFAQEWSQLLRPDKVAKRYLDLMGLD